MYSLLKICSQNDISLTIKLLDGAQCAFDVKYTLKGSGLVDLIGQHLKIIDLSYFGVQFFAHKENKWNWLQLSHSIIKQIKDVDCLLYFRVRFYAIRPWFIKEQSIIHQFYLQVTHDIAVALGKQLLYINDFIPTKTVDFQSDNYILAIINKSNNSEQTYEQEKEFLYKASMDWKLYGIKFYKAVVTNKTIVQLMMKLSSDLQNRTNYSFYKCTNLLLAHSIHVFAFFTQKNNNEIFNLGITPTNDLVELKDGYIKQLPQFLKISALPKYLGKYKELQTKSLQVLHFEKETIQTTSSMIIEYFEQYKFLRDHSELASGGCVPL